MLGHIDVNIGWREKAENDFEKKKFFKFMNDFEKDFFKFINMWRHIEILHLVQQKKEGNI